MNPLYVRACFIPEVPLKENKYLVPHERCVKNMVQLYSKHSVVPKVSTKHRFDKNTETCGEITKLRLEDGIPLRSLIGEFRIDDDAVIDDIIAGNINAVSIECITNQTFKEYNKERHKNDPKRLKKLTEYGRERPDFGYLRGIALCRGDNRIEGSLILRYGFSSDLGAVSIDAVGSRANYLQDVGTFSHEHLMKQCAFFRAAISRNGYTGNADVRAIWDALAAAAAQQNLDVSSLPGMDLDSLPQIGPQKSERIPEETIRDFISQLKTIHSCIDTTFEPVPEGVFGGCAPPIYSIEDGEMAVNLSYFET